jgi:outer membrane receptor for ferrienterochelin and colicins
LLRYQWENVQLQSGFIYTGVQYFYDEEISNDKYFFTPAFSLNLTYTIKKLEMNFNLNYKYNGKTPVLALNDDNEVIEGVYDPYQLLDISLGKAFFNNRVYLTIGGKNLLNVTNINASGSFTGSQGIHTSGAGNLPVSWGSTFFAKIKWQIAK